MRLILISNRLPVSVTIKDNKLQLTESAGGLASGLKTFLEGWKKANPGSDYAWAGWPGTAIPKQLQESLSARLKVKRLYPVYLSEKQAEDFYFGFSNNTLWPLFHSFSSFVSYQKEQWSAYREVNELFGNELAKIIKPGDVVWVNDYHLLLLPKILRERIGESIPIGFFLHTPFPVYEIFRLLPDKWRRSILSGMLGADLAGFHTYDYTQYFASCVQRILGFERTLDRIALSTRNVGIDTFPIGIDYKKFNDGATNSDVEAEIKKFKATIGSQRVILSIDRLDYTKGINKRLQAYELFLEKNPQFQGKVTLVLLVVPSRGEREMYAEMKREIDELVGKVNGRFGTVSWSPILYQYKSLPFAQLSALYNSSDVALITPLRDGMNLVAKEYVASRRGQTGVLVLSEMAGSASELGEAIIINPNHIEEIADALLEALQMPKERQIERNQLMQHRLRRYDIFRWGNDFLKELVKFKAEQMAEQQGKLLGTGSRNQIEKDFYKASKKLLLLDYDGSLVPFAKYPPLARPTTEALKVLTALSRQKDTTVAVISGRGQNVLDSWLKATGASLSAEHGIWIKENGRRWKMAKPLRNDWKESVLPVMRMFVDRVPGSFLEEKEYSLVWHYRMANPEMANLRAKELVSNLVDLTANMNVQILPGNKVVEARTAGVDKGSAALYFMEKQPYDFIMGVGDDTTDEDLFKVLPDWAYTIKVGAGQTSAKYIINNPAEVLALLGQLSKDSPLRHHLYDKDKKLRQNSRKH